MILSVPPFLRTTRLFPLSIKERLLRFFHIRWNTIFQYFFTFALSIHVSHVFFYVSWRMRESRYDLLCALLLGLGQLCMFTGYDTQLTIVEPVMHSVHDRSPSTIDAHAGYYGLSSCQLIFTVGNLAAPWALGILGSKYALLFGSMFFTLHIATFFYIHWIPYYITSALLGLGYALFYTGHGAYTTEHSTKTTIERNSALTWALAQCSMIVGGIVMFFTVPPSSSNIDNFMPSNSTDIGQSYRVYSQDEIWLMYGLFMLVTVLSNVIFAFIPTRTVNDSLAALKDRENSDGFSREMKRTISAFGDKYLLLLTPLFGYIGLASCVWISVYPTTLIFTKQLAGNIYLPAYYSIVFGLSDMMMGFFIGAVCKRVQNFSKLPTLMIGCVSFSLAMVLVLLSTPTWATTTPTDEGTLFIEPNFYLSLFIAVLFGIGDNCANTSRTVICALILPEKRAQVFSISKFHQSLMCALIMFLSPFFSVCVYFALMIGVGIISFILYRLVINDVDAEEKMATECEKPVPVIAA